MKKNSFIILFVILLVAVVLAGISRRRRADEARGPRLVVLSRLWSMPHEKEFVITDIFGPFEREHDCIIDFQTLDDESMLDRVKMQQRTGNVVTDIVIAYVSRMREWVESGCVADLTETVEEWQDRTFMEGFAEMTTFDGRIRFLPIAADTYLLCVNRNALEHLPSGVDPSGLTWDQLADWALAVADGEGEGKLAVTGAAQTMLIYQVACAVLSYGGGFPDIGSPQAVEAWKMFIRMRRAFTPTVIAYESVVSPMKRGEAWLTVSHSARVGEVYLSDPTRFLISVPPSGPAGMGSIAGVSGLGVVEGSGNRELADKFLKYMTSPEIQLRLAQGTGGFISTVRETMDLLGDTRQDEVMRNAAVVLAEGILAYIPVHPDWGAVKFIYDEAFRKLVLEQGELDIDYLEAAQRRLSALQRAEPGGE